MAKKSCLVVFLLGLFSLAGAQDLPQEELQVNMSGYFDSFNVNVIYPSFSLTRNVTETTSVTGRFLIDMITAASMKNNTNSASEGSGEDDGNEFVGLAKSSTSNSVNTVDAVSAASTGGGGEGSVLPSFDDVRKEYNLGISQSFYGSLFSLNGIYSTERDYKSGTIAGTISRQFALKNTTVQLGFVHSSDKVFPVTKDWKKSKKVVTYSANFSQLINKNALLQILTSYTENNGYLADAYSQVAIESANTTILYDPVHPNSRIRRAAATQFKYRLNEKSSIQLGYRYYWDSWEMVSNTISMNYMRHLSNYVVIGLGWRTYLQNRAYFFKPNYSQVEALMTSDVKLEKGYSNHLQFDLTLNGGPRQDYLPFLTNKKIQYNINLNIYQRHTQSGYWFNGRKNMIALNFNFGIRYRY